MEKNFYYTAIVEDSSHLPYAITLRYFNEDDMNPNMWAHVYDIDGTGEIVDSKNTNDEEMFKVGYYKVIKLIKTEVVEKQTTIYSK